MSIPVSSTAGRRQFEQTAVAKLVAEGVPKHVADAFVMHGVPKSGRYESLRDSVCKMKFERFFVEKSPADFSDPTRVGAYVPYVDENRLRKFHTQFQMSDVDAARFGKLFPEFEVVARGRTYNQHAFYANKRYAETELLMAMVYRHARVSGLNPRSVIDMGGNKTWHVKKDRPYVHCDNPVLSPRDIMRYKTREIFSGEDPKTACRSTFGACGHRADYAIAVHATYDVSPKALAYSMMRKGVKQFYGVINVMPGVEDKPEGTYEVDGLMVTVARSAGAPCRLKYDFLHDPSLSYNHRISIYKKYMYVGRSYEFVEGDVARTFRYSISSVRGNSLVFSIEETGNSCLVTDARWSMPSGRLYYVSLKFLGVDKLEVDAEFFDRLVLQVAGARNYNNYDIVSLFRYAKSLRQRVSINGIVLSSGYAQNPDELVYIVIAAFAVAAGYRVESAGFFKQATRQIVKIRGQGFFRDVFNITGRAVLSGLLALPAAVVRSTGYDVLNERLKVMIASGASVTVEVHKPHAGKGVWFDRRMLVPTVGDIGETRGRGRVGYTPMVPGGLTARYSYTFVKCAGVPRCFYSYGLPVFDNVEEPKETARPMLHEFEGVGNVPVRSEEFRKIMHKRVIEKLGLGVQFHPLQGRPLVLHNGDRIYRKNATDLSEDFVPASADYVVIRGLGSRAVTLSPPRCYERGNCMAFVLLFEKTIVFGEHSGMMSELEASGGVYAESSWRVPRSKDEKQEDVWQEVEEEKPKVVHFQGASLGAGFVEESIARGEYYMSGALPAGMPASPVSECSYDEFVQEYRSPFVEDAGSVDSDEEVVGKKNSSVSSSEVVPGRNAMEELVLSCREAEAVAKASTRAVVDMAITVARDEAPSVRWNSLASSSPGNIVLVKAEGGKWCNHMTGKEIPHMAVSDGDVVYERLTGGSPNGTYVTSDVMHIYTGGEIRRSVEKVMDDNYMCEVVCMNGVAGAGKTFYIVNHAGPEDVVLCETTGALEDTARKLAAKPGWRGHAYTVDSFLMGVQVESCHKLWIDEAFRLHAGKIFAVLKRLRPERVYCFGDDKQIPVMPYIPGFDFVYHEFPWTSVERMKESWRIPADVAMVVSLPEYYGFHVVTHNPVMRSLRGPVQYESDMFEQKPDGVPLMVFTKSQRDELIHKGVKYVMTIGQSQGHTFQDVIVFRESTLNKALYYSYEQALVAMTRHKGVLTYVTADAVSKDDSLVARALGYVKSKGSELLYSAHLFLGVRGAVDARALELRGAARPASVPSVSGEVINEEDARSELEDWADSV